MIRTLKAAFGLGLLAALSMAALSVMSASATVNGHFYAHNNNTTTILDIKEATGTAHAVKLSAVGDTVQCHHVKYTGEPNATPIVPTTTQSITVRPDYPDKQTDPQQTQNCTTSDGTTATVTMNGCHYIFKSRSGALHGTVHLVCPAGVKAEVHTHNGTLTFGTQTPAGGISYTQTGNTVTADVTVEGIHYECHGICAIFGTTGTNAKMTGSVTIEGTNPATGAQVPVTVT